MRALILAAGHGSRLQPITRRVPKPLVPLLERPLLARVIDMLDDAGLSEILSVIPDNTDLFRRFESRFANTATRLTWLSQRPGLGVATALARLRGSMAGETLIAPADIISSVRVREMISHHRRVGADLTIAVAPAPMGKWEGDVAVFDSAGRVTSYEYKPGTSAQGTHGSCGIWIFGPSVWPILPDDIGVDFSRDVLPSLTSRLHVSAFDNGPTRLVDFGDVEGLRRGSLEAVGGLFSLDWTEREREPGVYVADDVSLPASAQITAPVLIGQGGKIGEDVKIQGPAVIGRFSSIGRGAVVSQSVLFPGTHIQSGALVAGALVAERGWLSAFTRGGR